MTEPETARESDARSGDRRTGDRRRSDRRLPLPMWRRPWALVAYGVVGAVVMMLLLRPSADSNRERLEVTRTVAPPPVASGTPAAADAPPRDATSIAEFERLIAEGSAAEGQRVRTVLYCESTRSIALRNVDAVPRSIVDLADANRRVPGAECEWGTESNSPAFLLLVPPGLTTAFASAPVVRRGFVDRRRVFAEVEWLGRPDALALRTAGVLRGIGSGR